MYHPTGLTGKKLVVLVMFFSFASLAGAASLPCAGKEFAGTCWLIGNRDQSCVDLCSEYLMSYDVATATVAGNSFEKNKENCGKIASLFGFETDVKHCEAYDSGCVRFYSYGDQTYICDSRPTSPRSHDGATRRFCACK